MEDQLSKLKTKAGLFSELLETIYRLRAPGGCPWDREQTHQSLRPFLIEEMHEVLEVLDQMNTPTAIQEPRIQAHLKEELGDLLLQIALHSEIAREQGAFDLPDVVQALNEKMIRRHPHVFGAQAGPTTVGQVLQNWQQIKANEKKSTASTSSTNTATTHPKSVLEGMPKGLPALARAQKTIEKVSKVGFQWDDLDGPIAKLKEEIGELEAELAQWKALGKSPDTVQKQALQKRISHEIGDVLFCVTNLAHHIKIPTEDALRETLQRFEKRFRYVERQIHLSGQELGKTSLAEMDVYWDQAKQLEKIRVYGLTGGVASGKSTVSRLLQGLGAQVLDADQIAKELTLPGTEGAQWMQNLFGTSDRRKIREIIFKDAAKKQALEHYLHPRIQKAADAKILALAREHLARLASPAEVHPLLIIYEGTLLIETGRTHDFDGLIVIDSTAELQKSRLQGRDPLQPELAERMIQEQNQRTPPEVRKKSASHFLLNNGTLPELTEQVTLLYSQLIR